MAPSSPLAAGDGLRPRRPAPAEARGGGSARWGRGSGRRGGGGREEGKAEAFPLLAVVIGAPKSGATSLLAAAATETFPGDPPPALPGRTRLPPEALPDRAVPVVAVDARRRGGEALGELLRGEQAGADVFVLCYAADDPDSVDFLAAEVLPELQRLGVAATPVVLVGCKSDRIPAGEPLPTEAALARLIERYSAQIDVCLLASAKQLAGCAEVFAHAQRAVLHPLRPVFDRAAARLTPLCERALRRVFLLCDRDGDGALNDEELNAFQVRCFGLPLRPDELAGIRAVVRAQVPGGLTDAGALSLPGFFFLHALFVLRQRIDTTWAVLREFGYGDDLRLTRAAVARGGLEGSSGGGGVGGGGGKEARKEASALDQLCNAYPARPELSTQALHFLESVFVKFARGRGMDGEPGLRVPQDLDALFASAPENPWAGPALGRSVRLEGGIVAVGGSSPAAESLVQPTESPGRTERAPGPGIVVGRASFVAMWDLQMVRDPEGALASLLYLGWNRGAAAAFAVHGRSLGLGTGGALSSSASSLLRTPPRRVARCFLLCSEGIGAGCLLDGLVGPAPAGPPPPAASPGRGTMRGGGGAPPLGSPAAAAVLGSPVGGLESPQFGGSSPAGAAAAAPGKAERWAASTFGVPGQARGAALVIRQVREQDARLLAERGGGRGSGLAAADVLLLAYASDSLSSLRAVGGFVERLERAGSQLPCVLAVLEGPDGSPGAGQEEETAREAADLCQRFDLPPPLRVEAVGAAAGQGGVTALFPAVLQAARCPQGHVPETAETRRGRETRRLLVRALGYSAAGAAALAAGVWLYQAYWGASGVAGQREGAGAGAEGQAGQAAPSQG